MAAPQGRNAFGRRPHRLMAIGVGLLALGAPPVGAAPSPSSWSASASGLPSLDGSRRRNRFDKQLSMHSPINIIAPPTRASHALLGKLRGGASFSGGASVADGRSTAASSRLSARGGEAAEDATTALQKKAVQTITASIVAILAVLSVQHWETIRSSLSTFFDREKFRSAIIDRLNAIAARGNKGLLLYALGFVPYEVCGLPTSVVETAAGMAFGFERGLLGSFVGKTFGSLTAFTLGRTLLSDLVGKKMEEGGNLDLIEKGVSRNPMLSALVVRYSPFPQLLKNFALSVTRPVSYPMFLLAIVIHGLPFSVLWAALGEDSAMRLRASEAGESVAPNVVLNGLLVFVTVFGFVVSPLVTGWWLADLRKGDQNE